MFQNLMRLLQIGPIAWAWRNYCKTIPIATLSKKEIKKIGGGMESGIITASTSLYSSPVLLVKKKDGTCQFYVDCELEFGHSQG